MIAKISLIKHWKLITIVLLALVCLWLYQSRTAIKQDRNRISENFEQVTKRNSLLNLNLSEFKTLNTKDKAKIDSLLEVIKLKPKHIKQATVVNTVYRDTGIVKVIYKEPILKPDNVYEFPITSGNGCWGMKGKILSKDKYSKIEITERYANNSVQVIVQKKRGFWFWKKPEKIEVFSDCGEVNATIINLTK